MFTAEALRDHAVDIWFVNLYGNNDLLSSVGSVIHADPRDWRRVAEHFLPVSDAQLCAFAMRDDLARAAWELNRYWGNRQSSPRHLANKAAMRRRLGESDLGGNEVWVGNDFMDFLACLSKFDRPVAVKPNMTSGGSRGVTYLSDEHRTARAVRYAWDGALAASLDGWVLVETWIDGAQYTLDALVVNGKPFPLYIGTNTKQDPPHTVNLAIDFDVAYQSTRVDLMLERTVAALDYSDGPLHIEFVKARHELGLIEIQPRFGGSGVVDAGQRILGVNPYLLATESLWGSPFPAGLPDGAEAAHIRYLTPGDRLTHGKPIVSLNDSSLLYFWPSGSAVLESTQDRSGFIVSWAPTQEQRGEDIEFELTRLRGHHG